MNVQTDSKRTRRTKKECRALTKKAHKMVMSGYTIADATRELGLAPVVYHRNCKAMRLSTRPRPKLSLPETIKEPVVETVPQDNYRELLKEFLLDKFMNEKGMK